MCKPRFVQRSEPPVVDCEFRVCDCENGEVVEMWTPGHRHEQTVVYTIIRAMDDKRIWPAIADRYRRWKRPVLLLTDQRRVRVKALGVILEPAHHHAGRV